MAILNKNTFSIFQDFVLILVTLYRSKTKVDENMAIFMFVNLYIVLVKVISNGVYLWLLKFFNKKHSAYHTKKMYQLKKINTFYTIRNTSPLIKSEAIKGLSNSRFTSTV